MTNDPLMFGEPPESIVPLILFHLRNRLEEELQDAIPEGHPTQVVLVKIGRYRESPHKNTLVVAISPGDPEDPEFMDGRIDNEEFDNLRVFRRLPVGEIGGGEYWWRRYTAQLQVNYLRANFEEDLAMKYAFEVQGRALKAFQSITFNNLVDSFGEVAHGQTYIEGCSFFPTGAKNQFLWRGKLVGRVLTWRRPG